MHSISDIIIGVTAFPLVGVIDGHQHICISDRIYNSFPTDSVRMPESVLDVCPYAGTENSHCMPDLAESLSAASSPESISVSLYSMLIYLY